MRVKRFLMPGERKALNACTWACIVGTPMNWTASDSINPSLSSPSAGMSEELGIVDGKELACAVQNAEQGRDVATVPLLRTLALEDWLRSLRDYKRCDPDHVSLRLRVARVVS